MQLIRGLHNIRDRHRGCAVTIGNYDGVHRGHLTVLDGLKREARDLGVATCAVTFEPTPQEYFEGDAAPGRLSNLRDKYDALREQGIDRYLVLRFDQIVAAMSPQAFVQHVLVDGLRAASVVVGDDFRFGRKRSGDVVALREMGVAAGFTVHDLPTFVIDGIRVSSSEVRAALAGGEFERAERLLGRPYSMSGRVIDGERLGRDLGFPTANIRPRRLVLPLGGVFAVQVTGAGGARRPGVASLGTRPTVGGRGHLLEVHLFDFQRDLYGRHLTVEFVSHLRDEQHFDTVALMTEQMRCDAAAARRILGCEG